MSLTKAIDVLIVDDSSAIRKILQPVLQHADIPIGRIYQAADGVEAILDLTEFTGARPARLCQGASRPGRGAI